MMERAAGCRDEEGAVELFVLVVVLALIVALGIVVDLGGKMRADDRAAWTAQQAARVAASQVSGQIQGGTLPVVAEQGAVSAAQEVITAAGMTGTVSVSGGTVTVTTTTTYQPMVLGPGAWSVSQTATAQIVRGIDAPE